MAYSTYYEPETSPPPPHHDLWVGQRTCTACHLRKSCSGSVPNEGYMDARILLLGEAPGTNEDMKGRPFIGRAGEELEMYLKQIGLTRYHVFIANTTLCRPSGAGAIVDWAPTPEEMEFCGNRWLEPTLEMVKPEIVVSLGVTATSYMLGKQIKMASQHGISRWVQRDGWGFVLLPTYHPAAGMRAPGLMKVIMDDLKVVGRVLDGTWKVVEDAYPEPRYGAFRSEGA